MTTLKKELNSLADRLSLDNLSQATYFPKYFEIETIRGCNAKCGMCTVYEWNGRGLMQGELFSKIAEEIKDYSSWIERVCLSRNGEPLLDKKLPERIKALKDIGIKYVTFSTNASLLNADKSVKLIESGLDDIRFSVDGATKETFESIRKGLNFEEVIENCLQFIKLRDERGKFPVIEIRMALQSLNKPEEQEWARYWKERLSDTDIVSSKPIHSWGNQLKNYEPSLKGEKESKMYHSVPCVSPWSTMIVHFDGKVPLCGADYNNRLLMGDVTQSTIKSIWNSKNFENLRKIHASGERSLVSLCNGCNIWDNKRKKVYSK